MRCSLFLGLLVVASATAWGGPVSDQFSMGYEGVRWGLPLADLVGMMPEGDHYFSTAPGHRLYMVRNDEPILGVPRPGMRVQYHLGKDGGVESIVVGIPYDRHQQLLGALMSQFGRYVRATEIGDITYYYWPRDQQIQLVLRVTKDPRYGIAEFGINHLTSTGSALSGK
jgi:hypothetical protein